MNKLFVSIVMFLGGLIGVLSLLFISNNYNNIRYSSMVTLACSTGNSTFLSSLRPSILESSKSLGIYEMGILFFAIMIVGIFLLIINWFADNARKN